MPKDTLHIVSELLEKHQGLISFDKNKFTAKGDIDVLKNECDGKGIKSEKFGNTTLDLDLGSFIPGNLIYFDHLSTHFEGEFIVETFSILKSNGEYCYHIENTDKLEFSPNASDSFKIACKNAYYYCKLLKFIESIANHHNAPIREIIIYHAAKGILKVKYDAIIPNINVDINIDKKVNQIINAITAEFRSYFIIALFNFSDAANYISICEILEKSDEILEVTNRDYELVSKQFDFDKFRDSLYKEKEKFFSDIRTVIDKIFSQIVGIPISISASAFATDKVKNDPWVLLLVFIAFISYLVFYVRIQLIYKEEISDLATSFTNDFSIIKAKSGLPDTLIDSERRKINRKVIRSQRMINFMISFVLILGFLMGCYILYEFSNTIIGSVLKTLLSIHML